MRRVAQLLFAETDRLQYGGIDAERIDQGRGNGFSAPLAQPDIVFAAADGISMADDQEAVAEQDRVMQRIGDGADGAIRRRLDHRRVEIEIHFDGELRQVLQLRKRQRARRNRPRIIMDIVQGRLPHLRRGQIEPHIAADGGKAVGNLARAQPVLRKGCRQSERESEGRDGGNMMRFHCCALSVRQPVSVKA